MTDKNQLKVVMVGHVDHGKSTLIGRILYDTKSITQDKIDEVEKTCKHLNQPFNFAFLLDHLQEEREQGVTIDTTQTFFNTKEKEYVIIDAPGHVEFVKNMVTGAAQAEMAVLIVDAEEGCKEQTKRHAFLLSLLGVKEIVVAINKMDLIQYSEEKFQLIKEELEKVLQSMGLKASLFIPISALKGDNVFEKSSNMEWYKADTLLAFLDGYSSIVSNEKESFLLPVQDVYNIDNKRIIVGKIASGVISCGDEIKVLPSSLKTKIKSIEKFGEDIFKGEAGECIGITTEEQLFFERGQMLCSSGREICITNTFIASIFWLSPEPLKLGRRMKVRCSTQETAAEITRIIDKMDSSSLEVIDENKSEIRYLETCKVEIKTKKPFVISNFKNSKEIGRFVIVNRNRISAGGIIIDFEI